MKSDKFIEFNDDDFNLEEEEAEDYDKVIEEQLNEVENRYNNNKKLQKSFYNVTDSFNNAIKSYRKIIQVNNIQCKRKYTSTKLICINQVPLTEYTSSLPNKLGQKNTYEISISALREYLRSYTDIDEFCRNPETETPIPQKVQLFEMVRDIYTTELKHKCLYDLRKMYEAEDYSIPNLDGKLCYGFGSVLQYFKNDLTVILKTHFNTEDYPYLYPIEADNDTLIVGKNPNIFPLSERIEKIYSSSFMQDIEEFNNAEWSELVPSSAYMDLTMYQGYSINTQIFNKCCSFNCLKPDEMMLISLGLIQNDEKQEYTSFLSQIFLANLELNEYFYRRKFYTSSNSYSLDNMQEFKPIIYSGQSNQHPFCLKFTPNDDLTVMELLTYKIFPVINVNGENLVFIESSRIDKTINNRPKDCGVAYYLTRKDISLLTKIICRDIYKGDNNSVVSIYSYRYTNFRLFRIFLTLIEDKINPEVYKVLTDVYNNIAEIHFNFKNDYSGYTMTHGHTTNKNVIEISYVSVMALQLIRKLHPGKYKVPTADFEQNIKNDLFEERLVLSIDTSDDTNLEQINKTVDRLVRDFTSIIKR